MCSCLYTYMTDRIHTGHAESLYIEMRDPAATFSPRAEKTKSMKNNVPQLDFAQFFILRSPLNYLSKGISSSMSKSSFLPWSLKLRSSLGSGALLSFLPGFARWMVKRSVFSSSG